MLHFTGSATVSIQPSNFSVIEYGMSLNLTCNISFSGDVNYTWSLNDTFIPNESRSYYTISYTDQDSVKLGGTYQCYAHTSDVSVYGSSPKVLVLFAPHVIEHPSSVAVSNNDTVEFTCTAIGYPTPTIEWKRVMSSNVANLTALQNMENELPMNTNNVSITGTNNETSTLTIDPVQYEDYGYYLCMATLSSSDIVFVSDCCNPVNINTSDINSYTTLSSVATLTGNDFLFYKFN